MLNNLLYRLGDWAKQNRVRLFKTAAVIILACIGALLIYNLVERIHAWRYEKRVEAIGLQIKAAELRAKEAEGRAQILQSAIEEKYTEIRQLEGRAKAAEDALKYTKGRVITLKEAYETVRYVPIAGPVSCESACSELAAVGYKCQ